MHQLRLLIIPVLSAVILATAGAADGRGQATAPPAVTPAPPAKLDGAALEKKVDELLTVHMKGMNFTGTVLLAAAGKPLLVKGYGDANIEWQIPNGAQTRFRIGSITKQFTSMLIMLLREQGKVKLEDSVCAFVTPCPETWKPVTIHHLLTHTSGIPTYTGIASWREANMVPKTVDQIIAIFRDLPLQWTPGENFAYNNSGYFLLGAVIEKVAGKKYEQALQDMILTPLRMTDTGYDWSHTIMPRRASGYTMRDGVRANAPALDMQQPYAAGAMYSTVEDLLKWDQALYTDTLLPEASRKIMWTPFKNNYAYGWVTMPASAETFGHRRVTHGGGINGFSSVIIRIPDTNVTAIVLSNSDAVNAGAVGRELLGIYYGKPFTPPPSRTVADVNPAVFDQYVGKYELAPTFVVAITREENRLMAQATGQGKFEIFPESETVFFAKVPQLSVRFVKDADGKVSHFVLSQGGKDQQARKIE